MAVAVHLYECPAAPALRVGEVAAFLRATFGGAVAVDVRPPFFDFALGDADDDALGRAAARFAMSKVRHPSRAPPASLPPAPLFQEVAYERRRLRGEARAVGLLYDGERYAAAMRDLVPRSERSLDHAHVVFTEQLLGTWSSGDERYHARVLVAGFPSLLSTTGLVEGPARPRAFYAVKRQHQQLQSGVPTELLERALGDAVLQRDDPRTTRALEGYAAQALLHHLDGEPFCPDPHCALFNAHWQEEVVAAQLAPRAERFCPRHAARLRRLREERA